MPQVKTGIFLEKLLKQVSTHVEPVQQVFTWKILQNTIRFPLKGHTLKNHLFFTGKVLRKMP